MTLDILKKLFAQMMDEDADLSSVTRETSLRGELGFTSLYMMWMAFAIEEEFSISLSNMNVHAFETVGDICDYIDGV